MTNHNPNQSGERNPTMTPLAQEIGLDIANPAGAFERFRDHAGTAPGAEFHDAKLSRAREAVAEIVEQVRRMPADTTVADRVAALLVTLLDVSAKLAADEFGEAMAGLPCERQIELLTNPQMMEVAAEQFSDGADAFLAVAAIDLITRPDAA